MCNPRAFPLSANATYTPHTATFQMAQENAGRLNLPNLVFVQPSTYGYNNSCLLDALSRTGPQKGRGVVVFNPDTTNIQTLREWHDRGVRGVRVNLKSVNQKMSAGELEKLLCKYSEAIKPLKTWALQLYIDMPLVEQLEWLLPDLGVKVVFDHYGSPLALKKNLSDIPGLAALLRLLENPQMYVKVSAPYRFSQDLEFKDMEMLTKRLYKACNGNAVVFSSDWPHTRLESVDVQPFVQRCLEWTEGDIGLQENIFRNNAEQLWDVQAERVNLVADQA